MSDSESDFDLNESTSKYAEKLQEYFDLVANDWREMMKLWKHVGFKKDKLYDRNKLFFQQMCEWLDEVKDGEYELEERIEASIQQFKEKTNDLVQRLNIDLNNLNIKKDNQLTLIEEEKFYKDVLKQIEIIKIERKEKYNELKSKERELCCLLNEDSYSISDVSAIAENELENLENHIVSLAKEKQRRVLLMKQYQEDALKISMDYGLELPASSKINELLVLKSFDELNFDYIYVESVRHSIDKFKKRRNDLINEIDQLRLKISDIWIKLRISNDQLNNYLLPESGYNQLILHKLQEEYDRCLQIKKENLGNFIESIRADIKILWKKCLYSETDSKKFEAFYSDVKSDDILEEHEMYLSILKQYFKENENMFELINEWETLWAGYMNFEHEYSDPNRFKSRNYSSLFEERERKRFNTELPKLETNLLKHVSAAEQNENKIILVYGARVADYIKEKKESYNAMKEEQKKRELLKLIKKDKDLKHEAQFGSSINTIKTLTPVNRIKNTNLKGVTAPVKRVLNSAISNSITASSSGLGLKFKSDAKHSIANSTSSTRSVTLSLKNKENLAKRALQFKQQQQQQKQHLLTPDSKTSNQSPSVNNIKKRTSIKSLNEKFKRRSKHLIPAVKNSLPSTPQPKSIKECIDEPITKISSPQFDENESGICAGGSTASTSNEMNNIDAINEPKLKIPKIIIEKASLGNMSDNLDDNFDYEDGNELEFKDNDFISSTLLENL